MPSNAAGNAAARACRLCQAPRTSALDRYPGASSPAAARCVTRAEMPFITTGNPTPCAAFTASSSDTASRPSTTGSPARVRMAWHSCSDMTVPARGSPHVRTSRTSKPEQYPVVPSTPPRGLPRGPWCVRHGNIPGRCARRQRAGSCEPSRSPEATPRLPVLRTGRETSPPCAPSPDRHAPSGRAERRSFRHPGPPRSRPAPAGNARAIAGPSTPAASGPQDCGSRPAAEPSRPARPASPSPGRERPDPPGRTGPPTARRCRPRR